MFAIIVAIVLRSVSSHGPISALSGWFNSQWSVKPSLLLIIEHIVLIWHFDYNSLDMVIWTLVHETRICLIFPFLVWWVQRTPTLATLISCISITYISLFSIHIHFIQNNILAHDIIETVSYIPLFVMGIVLAQNQNELIKWYSSLSASTRGVLVLTALLVYPHACYFIIQPALLRGALYYPLAIFSISIFILTALSPGMGARFLGHPSLIFLGRISYSFYLFHAILLLTIFHILQGKVSISSGIVLSVLLSIIVATISYRFIEKPSMRLGRLLAAKAGMYLLLKKPQSWIG